MRCDVSALNIKFISVKQSPDAAEYISRSTFDLNSSVRRVATKLWIIYFRIQNKGKKDFFCVF